MLKKRLVQGIAARVAVLSLGILLAGSQSGIAQTDTRPAQPQPENTMDKPAPPAAADQAQQPAPPQPSISSPAAPAGQQANQPEQPKTDAEKQEAEIRAGAFTGGSAADMLHVPVSRLHPGTVPINPNIESPVANDPEAVRRGMQYFTSFNCAGCHAANGGGGMGPSLSNAKFIYGSDPANIYLTILQGRPNGMPAWGGMLPDKVIWDLVAYVQSLSKDVNPEWGKTISLDTLKIEQVPAEYMKTETPWKYTEPFSFGQKPDKKVNSE